MFLGVSKKKFCNNSNDKNVSAQYFLFSGSEHLTPVNICFLNFKTWYLFCSCKTCSAAINAFTFNTVPGSIPITASILIRVPENPSSSLPFSIILSPSSPSPLPFLLTPLSSSLLFSNTLSTPDENPDSLCSLGGSLGFSLDLGFEFCSIDFITNDTNLSGEIPFSIDLLSSFIDSANCLLDTLLFTSFISILHRSSSCSTIFTADSLAICHSKISGSISYFNGFILDFAFLSSLYESAPFLPFLPEISPPVLDVLHMSTVPRFAFSTSININLVILKENFSNSTASNKTRLNQLVDSGIESAFIVRFALGSLQYNSLHIFAALPSR
ncbi:hypothetical protein BB560_003413 [Smittium megazygosporum]|uniref:Uncharacterized protein n=1 Tax=Smittium megazygosporum TaxID=133381 RepID=A0A2T9ZC60_9FUNG|nr:hypothetical protein BB560_003413 [Smittium megazygosporum]